MDENQGKTGAGTKKLFKAAICPNCGGELQLDADQEQAFCIYCGSKIIVKEAVRKVVVDNRLTVENMMKAAQIAYRAGDYDEAEDRYSRVLEMDPDNYDAVFWEGICLGMKSSEKTRELVNYAQLSLEMFSKPDVSAEEIYQRSNYMGTELMKVAKERSSIRYYVIRLLDNPLTWEDAGKRLLLLSLVKDTLKEAEDYGIFYQQNGEWIVGDKICAELKSILTRLIKVGKQEEQAEAEQKRQKAESEQARYWAEHYEELQENIEALKKNIILETKEIKNLWKKAEEVINQINSYKEELNKRRYYLVGRKAADYSGAKALSGRLENICGNASALVNRCYDLTEQLRAEASYLKAADREAVERFTDGLLLDKKEWKDIKEEAAGLSAYVSEMAEKKSKKISAIGRAGVVALAAVAIILVINYIMITIPTQRYNEGVAYFNAGKFKEAKAIFDEMGYDSGERFKDGEIMVNSDLESYLAGRILMEDGEYQDARIAFGRAGDYKNAVEMKQECSYQIAKQEFTNEDFEQAANDFGKLSGYSASEKWQVKALFQYMKYIGGDNRGEVYKQLQELAKKNEKYRKAILDEGDQLFDSKNYEWAAKVYQIVKDDEEADALYKEAIYLEGNMMMRLEDYSSAIENYQKVRGYKDVEYQIGLAYYHARNYTEASTIWSDIPNKEDYPEIDKKMKEMWRLGRRY